MPDEPKNQWQAEVKQALHNAIEYLWSDAGHHELNYLRSRGFTDDTIKRYGIGFNPNQYLLNVTHNGEPVKALTGFWIPTFMRMYNTDPKPTTLMRVKVRTEEHIRKANPNFPKYLFIKGGNAVSLFCAGYARSDTKDCPNIIYCEGEMDAMTINQTAGDICRAVTFGSNGYIGNAEKWWQWYRMPDTTIICFDNDSDSETMKTVRKNEQRLQAEIIKAQGLDKPEYRADAPVIRHLPEQYHDWNDILTLPDGAQTIRNILSDWFGVSDGIS